MLFSFLNRQKPIGIYITDEEVILVALKKGQAVPKLHKVLRKPLPMGAVDHCVIKDPKPVVDILTELRKEMEGATGCTVALPVGKVYSAVLPFSEGIEDEVLLKSLHEKADTLLPVLLKELRYETSILHGAKEREALVFLAGVEEAILQSYEKVLADSGWTDSQFVLETLALAKAIPVKLRMYESLMFIHSFGKHALMSSVFHGRLFDGIHSHELKADFQATFESYLELIGHAPTHVVVSGDLASLGVLAEIPFEGEKPKFVSAEFKVSLEGQTSVANDLIIPTGLSLVETLPSKNHLSLLNLLPE